MQVPTNEVNACVDRSVASAELASVMADAKGAVVCVTAPSSIYGFICTACCIFPMRSSSSALNSAQRFSSCIISAVNARSFL